MCKVWWPDVCQTSWGSSQGQTHWNIRGTATKIAATLPHSQLTSSIDGQKGLKWGNQEFLGPNRRLPNYYSRYPHARAKACLMWRMVWQVRPILNRLRTTLITCGTALVLSSGALLWAGDSISEDPSGTGLLDLPVSIWNLLVCAPIWAALNPLLQAHWRLENRHKLVRMGLFTVQTGTCQSSLMMMLLRKKRLKLKEVFQVTVETDIFGLLLEEPTAGNLIRGISWQYTVSIIVLKSTNILNNIRMTPVENRKCLSCSEIGFF